jgi:hypothetical protein
VSAQRPVLALLVALFACNGEESEPDPACLEQMGTVVVPAVSDVPLQGKVTLLDRETRTLGEDGVPQDLLQGRVQAAFFDISARTATEAAFSVLSDECVGRISRGQPAQGLVPLSLTTLEVRGTARGAIRAMEVDPGLYLDAGAPIFASAPLQVVGEAADFPAFDEQIDAPDPIALSNPALDGMAPVEFGNLDIAWNRGNGDFVLVTIDPDVTMGAESGGDVTCILADDGCQTLPTSVAVFLLASQSPTFTLIVSRHRYRAIEIDAQTFLELESIAEVRGTLVDGDGE